MASVEPHNMEYMVSYKTMNTPSPGWFTPFTWKRELPRIVCPQIFI